MTELEQMSNDTPKVSDFSDVEALNVILYQS